MTRSVYKLVHFDPGFRPDHLLTMRLDMVGPKYDKDPSRQQAFIRDALDSLESVPGVTSAAFTLSLPVEGSEWGSVFIVGDQPVPERSQIPSAAFNPISKEYFRTMEIQLLHGRLFNEADGPNSPYVAVINETMARRFWPNENPIGKRLKQGWPEWGTPWREVVGVVADVKLNGVMAETPLHVYLPLAQSPSSGLFLAVRTRVVPASMLASVESALHAIDSDLPVYQVRTMDEVFSRAILPQRAAMVLLGGLALLAILLAAVGIYGVMSWGVVQRTREVGLRMALGAQASDALKLIMKQGIVPTSIGVVLGLLASLGLTRVLSSLLFGVDATDPSTFVAIALLLFGVALLACYIPARRAAKIDPMVALRCE